MTLAPGRFDYAPINDRPIIKWPNNARVAFWVAPNMEFFEYLPENRPTQPDIPHYSRTHGLRQPRWLLARLIPLSQVDQHLGLAGRARSGAGFNLFGGS